MKTLQRPGIPDYLCDVQASEGTDLAMLKGAPIVVISSVLFTDLDDYNGVRFRACLAATDNYSRAGVPQLVMVDPASDHRVAVELAKRGAIVVQTPRGGLARPYLDAAQLVLFYAGRQVSIIKAEADRRIRREDLIKIRSALRVHEVVVCERTQGTWESMAPIQQRCEALIDAALRTLLGLPPGVSFGAQGYSREGIAMLLSYEGQLQALGDNWMYLLYVPVMAKKGGLSVGSVVIDVRFNQKMVAVEEQNPLQTLKRFEQVVAMQEGAQKIAAMIYSSYDHYQPPSPERLLRADGQAAHLRSLIAAAA